MQVYSKNIIQFIREIKETIKFFLAKELFLEVGTNRFFNKDESFSYPIKVVIFNNKPMLGYFNSEFYELGFHETLMRSSKEQLKNIIRHELAHYVTFINHGPSVQAHGSEFKTICKNSGWDSDVYSATTCIDDAVASLSHESSTVLRRVQKLMALSSSQNENESEQAMIKSQQLLVKYHLETIDAQTDEEKVFLKRILRQKRENAKMRSIALILETFFVNIVYSKSSEATYLEIVGSALNIEIAEYVADFLDFELDKLWDLAREKHKTLKGLIAKNSFYLGIAKGFCDKIEFLKKEYQRDGVVGNGLMIIEKKLIEAKEMVYPHLRKSKSSGSYSHEASMLGQQMGKSLSIRPGVGSASKNSGASLTYSK